MALKAGYIGIKKTMLGLINSLSTAKIIKSFGNGLNLTNAGELNITSASSSTIGGVKVGEGLEITENGVLNVISQGGYEISVSEETLTNIVYDNKPVYCKSFSAASLASEVTEAFTLSDGRILWAEGSYRYTYSSEDKYMPCGGQTPDVGVWYEHTPSNGKVLIKANYYARDFEVVYNFYYIKTATKKRR